MCSLTLFLLLLCLLLALVVAQSFFLQESNCGHSSSHCEAQGDGEHIKSVQRIPWLYNDSNPHHMTDWLSTQGTPLVLTNTPFDSWPSSQWTPHSLTLAAKKGKIAPQVLSKYGSEPVFMYYAVEQPLSSIDTISPSKSYRELIYSSEKYFSILQEPFDGYYYYSSGGVELLQTDDIFTEESLESLTFSAHRHFSEDREGEGGGGLGQVNYWLGKENVTAYTHYDTSYNLHMVVYGQKKFTIFHPKAYRQLKLYPCLHQFYRQVQTDIYDEEICDDIVEKLNGIEVLVNPGEVLYLPPYWFHSVVTMKTTVSFNVWSQSEAFIMMEDVYASAIPFEEEWGTVKLMQALNYLLKRLIESVLLSTDAHRFIKECVYDRYRPFHDQLNSIVSERDMQNVQNFCLKTNTVSEVFSTEEVAHINEGVSKIATLFETVQPRPVLEINLANYIEHITWRILGTGNIALLPFYLHLCF